MLGGTILKPGDVEDIEFFIDFAVYISRAKEFNDGDQADFLMIQASFCGYGFAAYALLPDFL